MKRSFWILWVLICVSLSAVIVGCGEETPVETAAPGTSMEQIQNTTGKATAPGTVTAPPIASTAPATKPTEPTETKPKATEPAVTTPKPTTPAVTTPKPTTPAVTTPKPTEPVVTTPKPTEPATTTPKPTEAPTAPTTSKPTTPAPTAPTTPTTPTTPPAPTAPADGKEDVSYLDAGDAFVDEGDPAAVAKLVTEYDSKKRPIHQEKILLAGNKVLRVIDWTYHTGGNETEEIVKYNNDGSFASAEKSVKNKNGKQIEFVFYEQPGVPSYWSENAYDANNNLTETKWFQSDGSKTVTSYRKNGSIIKSETWQANGDYSLLECDEDNNELHYIMKYPDGRSTEVWQDSKGTELGRIERNADGTWSEWEYNAQGKLTKYNRYAADENIISCDQRQYHANGNISKRDYFDNSGQTIRETYNESGICTLKTTGRSDGSSEMIKYTDAGVMTSKRETTAEGDITEYIYDASGKLQKQEWLPVVGGRTVTEYDAKGNEIKKSYFDKDGKNTGIQVNEYNSANKLVKEIYYFPEGGRMETEYNVTGQESRKCMYNSAGKLTSEDIYTRYPSGFMKTTTSYDEDRNYTIISYYENAGMKERMEYTANGRLTEKQVHEPDGSSVMEEYREDGLVEADFIFGPGYDLICENQYTYRSNGTVESVKRIDKKTWAYDITTYASDGKTKVETVSYDANGKEIGRVNHG
ncbi:MAG: hypothetical protein E7438_08575 [Ruminococcaceae bacterium]|nr:hypothetical protein [Oscillospiraceae bacterium]